MVSLGGGIRWQGEGGDERASQLCTNVGNVCVYTVVYRTSAAERGSERNFLQPKFVQPREKAFPQAEAGVVFTGKR